MITLLIKTFHYTLLAFCETFRIRQTLIPTFIIVVGMALPAAMQMGFRDGLGRDLENAITKSPRASEIQITATSKNGAFTSNSIQGLIAGDKRIRLVIPDVTKVVQMPIPGTLQDPQTISVTLLPTVAGDPYLKFYDADLMQNGDFGILLSSHLAEQLKIPSDDLGQGVEIQLSREEDSGLQNYRTTLPIRGVADFAKAPIAYVNWELMDRLEAFHQGEAVTEFGWSAMAREAAIGFEQYLAFSKSHFSPRDTMKLLAHGLQSEKIPENQPEASLWGVLQHQELHAYRIFAEGVDPTQGHGLLSLSAGDVERISDVDDVVVPWSEPLPESA